MQPFAKSDWADDDKIVIGIDIGTTHTAVSFAHLYAGSIPFFSISYSFFSSYFYSIFYSRWSTSTHEGREVARST